jgi:hypothetical protein
VGGNGECRATGDIYAVIGRPSTLVKSGDVKVNLFNHIVFVFIVGTNNVADGQTICNILILRTLYP